MLIRPLLAASVVVVVAFAFVALAHEESLVSLADDGRLSGLPEEYGSAFLRVDRRESEWKVEVELGGRRTQLPRCLVEFFENSSKPLEIGASWYHDSEYLPPYLSIGLAQKPGRADQAVWLDIAFALDDARLVAFDLSASYPERSGQLAHMDPARVCTPDELRSLRFRPAV
ncbi:MAG: hypothetical protein NXI30_03740 [bacterium]|nr:hypothetical protein [bacterium]